MEFFPLIERFVSAHFPRADVVVLAGSTSRSQRTPTSDIDLLILGDRLFDDGRESLAATYRFEREVFEVFAYTSAGYETWATRGLEQHRPVIVQMLLDGVTVRGDEERAGYRRAWEPRYAEGPILTSAEHDHRRYVITDILDDFVDATDPLELHVLASALFERTAELVLLTNHRWIGAGKYLPRRLREFDPERAERLSAPLLTNDHAAFAGRVREELERAGGRLQAGYSR